MRLAPLLLGLLLALPVTRARAEVGPGPAPAPCTLVQAGPAAAPAPRILAQAGPAAAPAPAATPSTTAAPAAAPSTTAAPAAAPSTTAAPAAAAPAPYARTNRFAISLSFGFGSASLERFHDLVDRYIGSQMADPPKSELQINSEFAFRYYFPYYILAQVSYDALYNKASSSVGGYKVYTDTLVMETPVLLGGYYPFVKRFYAYGAIGPSVFFFPRSYWDIDPGSASDFKADPGVGFHFLTGADFLVTEVLAVGLELRYRYLKAGEIKEKNSGAVQSDGKGTYDLDFSGVSLGVLLRFYVI